MEKTINKQEAKKNIEELKKKASKLDALLSKAETTSKDLAEDLATVEQFLDDKKKAKR